MGKVWKYPVELSETERAQLHTLIGGGEAPARAQTHARILLKANCGEAGLGWADAAIAGALAVGLSTVARVRERYVREGLEAALWHRPSIREYRRKLDGAQEAHLIAVACGALPEGEARWSLRLLAEQLVVLEEVASISHETVRQVLKKTNSNRG